MSGRVVPIDPPSDGRWDEFVGRHPRAGVFHTSAWLDVIQRTYQYHSAHLGYEVDGTLHGVLPLLLIRSPLTGARLVSLPYSGPAGPLGASDAAVDALVTTALRRRAELGCAYMNLQVRHRLPPPCHGRLPSTEPTVCSAVPLAGDPSALWASLGKTRRWEIRTAQRLGVTVATVDGDDALRRFYALHARTHRKHGLPPQPYRLFERMLRTLGPRGMLQLHIASLDGCPVHAAICLRYKDVCSLLYTGTDDRFVRWHPGKLLHWTAISLACRDGYRQFDFLQSDVEDAGLRWYKRSFGSVETPVTFYFDPELVQAVALKNWLVRGQSTGSRLVRAAVRRAPAPALRMLGSVAFRHMG
jgi:CelD/BcsL family acetyltransferase involved in cellulose biosynthesis